MIFVSKNKKPLIIAGLDLSLTRSGFTILDENSKVLHQEFLNTKEMRGMQRLLFIKQRVLQKLKQFEVSQVMIEGYSFGSKGRSIVSLGELGGVIRVAMFENGFSYIDCSPNSLKAYTAGNGQADKGMMQMAILTKYGINYEDDNVCDSYALCKMFLELREETESICAEGGAEKIRQRRIAKIKTKLGEVNNFRSLLRFNSAKRSDFLEQIKVFESQKSKQAVWDFLGIEQAEYEKLITKTTETLKLLNKKYSQDLLLELANT